VTRANSEAADNGSYVKLAQIGPNKPWPLILPHGVKIGEGAHDVSLGNEEDRDMT
jgi:hypothetical protein